MPPTIGGVTIDPQGQTLTVSITPAAKVYTDQSGMTPASFPATVTTRTSYYVSAAQQFAISVKNAQGTEIADRYGNPLVLDIQQGVMEGIAPVLDRPGPEEGSQSGTYAPSAVVGIKPDVVLGDTSTSVQTANAAALQAAITAAITAGHRTVLIPSGGYCYFNSTLTISTTLGVRFQGLAMGPANDGFTSSVLAYTGTGEAILNGSDDGQAYNVATNYNGPEGTTLHRIALIYAGSATSALANGFGNYGTGTYGIRDWRGGRLTLDESYIAGFEYGVWGLKSDENTWTASKFKRCKTAVWLGPRCDQLRLLGSGEITYCDQAMSIDRCWNGKVEWSIVDCGVGSTCAVWIGSSYAGESSDGWLFDGWFENILGPTCDAFVSLGVSSTGPVYDTKFEHPELYTHASPSTRTKSFLKIDNAFRTIISDPVLSAGNTFDQLIEFVGTNNADVMMRSHRSAQRTVLNSGSGAPKALHIGSATDGASLVLSDMMGASGGKLTADLFDGPNANPEGTGMAWTVDPRSVLTNSVFSAVNETRWARVKGGGSFTSVEIVVGTASGNVCVSVHDNTGSGTNARPGARVATSGSVACPSGTALISLGGTVTVKPGQWIGLQADNTTATFGRVIGVGGGGCDGLSCLLVQSFPIPSGSPASTPATTASVTYLRMR